MKGLIWGLDRPTCDGKLDSLIADYSLYWNIKPIKIKKSRFEYTVMFENKDIWRAVVATDAARGNRCNISLVDKRISHDFLPIIKNSTSCPPFHSISYY